MTDPAVAPIGKRSAGERCSDLARGRGDALVGSALPTRAFLLVEDPGPWGAEPHPTGSLAPNVVDELHRLARELSARLLLIRRPGRAAGGPRTWALADVATRSLRVGTVSDPSLLARIDPTSDGWLDESPWYLVCAQGRHDACCAIRGRPVARALEGLGGVVWECTHVGGDRFAANVLVLPDGLMYGYLDFDAATRLHGCQSDGRLLTDHLRGQCGSPPAAQVAEDAVRRAVAEDRMDAVVVVSVDHLRPGSWRIRLTHSATGRAYVVDVDERHEDVESGLTCSGQGPGRLRTFSVAAITP